MSTRKGSGVAALAAVILSVTLETGAGAQTCVPTWGLDFAHPATANANGCTCLDNPVFCTIVHDDDGPGPIPPALYVGGNFMYVGGLTARGIGRYDATAAKDVALFSGGSSRPNRAVRTDAKHQQRP